MNTLKDWADYYLSKKIYTYPSNHQYDLKEWRYSEIAKKTFNSLAWDDSINLYGITGINGIRAVRINVEGYSDNYIDCLIKDIYTLLGLSQYPWLIRQINCLYLIVETDDNSNRNVPSYFSNIELLWQSYFPMPIWGGITKFYFNGIPTIHPAHIESKTLIHCARILDNYLSELRRKRKEGNNNESSILKQASLFTSDSYLERTNAQKLGLTISEYRKFKKEEGKRLREFKKNLDKKFIIKRRIAIGIIIVAVLLFVIGMLCSDVVRDIFVAVGTGIVVISFFYLILNEPLGALFENFKKSTNKERFKTIIAATVTILIFILFFGGIIFLLFGLPELLKD